MATYHIILARQFAIAADSPETATGELGIVRDIDGLKPFLSNNLEGANTYKQWMEEHFGSEARYEVISFNVNI